MIDCLISKPEESRLHAPPRTCSCFVLVLLTSLQKPIQFEKQQNTKPFCQPHRPERTVIVVVVSLSLPKWTDTQSSGLLIENYFDKKRERE